MVKKPRASELGFGQMASENAQRIMNKDGSANVRRIGGPSFSGSDLFHQLTTMKWQKFILIVLTAYAVANLIFATLYYVSGIEFIGVQPSGIFWKDYLEAFFFSTQCFTTIGFGRVNPQSISTNFIASVEGLAGLLSLAIATGLLYGRFSRPRAHLIHSDNILIAPYKPTGRALMFRIASTRRHSLLIESTVSVSLGINLPEHGTLKRRFFILKLELEKINFMNTSWTVVHPIDSESPLYNLTAGEMINGRAEIMVLYKAMEETTSQTVMERFSYFTDEIVWGARFISAIGRDSDGRLMLDLDKISDFESAELQAETPVIEVPKPKAARSRNV